MGGQKINDARCGRKADFECAKGLCAFRLSAKAAVQRVLIQEHVLLSTFLLFYSSTMMSYVSAKR